MRRRRIGSAARTDVRMRSQQGYVLGVVLAAMVIGLSLVTALLGLSFATQSAAISQQRMARENRAIDGALEVGVETLRGSTDALDACGGAGSPGFPFDVPMDIDGDGTPDAVDLRCDPALDPTPNVTGGVKLLGDSYAGAETFGIDAGSLRHEGDSPLRFVGNVSVVDGAVVSGSPVGARVSGTYRQEAAGHGGSSGCGVLSKSYVPADASRQLWDADDDGEPECESSAIPPVPNVQVPRVPNDDDFTLPACVPGGDVSLPPGYYGPQMVVALNALLACGAARYLFEPVAAGGDTYYWFDAGENGSLQLAGAGSEYVFGTAGAAGSGCQPGAPGVTVVLGGGTDLEHTAGEVSMCAGPANTYGALVQSEKVVSQPELIVTSSELQPRDRLVGPAPTDQLAWAKAELDGSVPLTATISYPGGGSIDSLELRFKSWERPPSFAAGRKVNVQVSKPGFVPCNLPNLERGRVDGRMEISIDLLDADSLGCLDQFYSPGALDGATLAANFTGPAAVLNPPRWAEIFVSEIRLVTNAKPLDATGQSGGWKNDASVRVSDGAYAHADDPINCIFEENQFLKFPHICERTGTETAVPLNLDFDGATLPSGVDEDDRVSTLALALDIEDQRLYIVPETAEFNITAYRDSFAAGETTVSITRDGTTTQCTPSYPSYTRSRQTVHLDISNCLADLTFGDLEDLDVTIEMLPERRSILTGAGFRDAGVELPWLDYVRLVATTDSPESLSNISVTVDEAAASPSSFRVNGDTVVPGANLDITWSSVTGNDSLFNGELTAWSLGSKAVGLAPADKLVVCCGSDDTNLVVEARSDPADFKPRGLARVRLQQTAGLPTQALITDWQLCDRDGCTVDIVPLSP